MIMQIAVILVKQENVELMLVYAAKAFPHAKKVIFGENVSEMLNHQLKYVEMN